MNLIKSVVQVHVTTQRHFDFCVNALHGSVFIIRPELAFSLCYLGTGFNCKNLLKALCHDIRAIFNKLVSHDITAPTRLKSHTEFSINGCSS